MLTHIQLSSIKIVKIRAIRIGGSFSKKLFLRTNGNSNLSAWHTLPKNRDVVASLHLAFINRDGRCDKNASHIDGDAGSSTYWKSQKRRPYAFVIFAVDGENIISARDAGNAYGKQCICAGNGSGSNLRVLQNCYRTFGVSSTRKSNAGGWSNIATPGTSSAPSAGRSGSRRWRRVSFVIVACRRTTRIGRIICFPISIIINTVRTRRHAKNTKQTES